MRTKQQILAARRARHTASAPTEIQPEVIMVREGEFDAVMDNLFPSTAGQADAGADIQRKDWRPDERSVIWEGRIGDAPDWLFPERTADEGRDYEAELQQDYQLYTDMVNRLSGETDESKREIFRKALRVLDSKWQDEPGAMYHTSVVKNPELHQPLATHHWDGTPQPVIQEIDHDLMAEIAERTV